MTSAWIYLVCAGLLEIAWAVGLKYTAGFTRALPSALVLIALAGSMFLLAKATEVLPMGTAYAIWVGIGAVGAAVLGMILFEEPVTLARVTCLLLLVTSLVGLKLTAA